MRFNGEYLETIAELDHNFSSIWFYIHKSDLLGKKIRLPINNSELPGSCYAMFLYGESYSGDSGEIEFTFDEEAQTFSGKLHFETSKISLTCGTFDMTELDPPVK